MAANDLKHAYLFQGLSGPELEQIVSRGREKKIGAGEYVYHKGDEGKDFYVIAEGKVELIVDRHGDFSCVSGQISTGGHFGEVSLLTGKPRSLSVRAMIPTTLQVFDAEAFTTVLLANNRIHRTLDKALAERLSLASDSWSGSEASGLSPGHPDRSFPAASAARQHIGPGDGTGAGRDNVEEDFELARKIRRQIHSFGTLSDPLLISGEPGTGRRLAAKQIHLQGAQRSQAYIELDIREFDAWIWEGKLFGYKQDSFPFASGRQLGILEQIHQGTLVFFHAEELSRELQHKLCDACRRGSFRSVGSATDQPLGMRLVFITDGDLASQEENDIFIPELVQLLAPHQFALPPLREHKQDIVPLVQFYLKRYNGELNKRVRGVTADALGMLVKYDWPGNLTELASVIHRAVMVAQGEEIVPEQIFLGPPRREGRISFNLLRFPAVRKLFEGSVLQGLGRWVFVLFCLILLALFLGPQDPAKNLGITLCWYVGWPLLIISFFFLPRFWCSICALSAPGKMLQKHIRPERRFPPLLARHSGWIMALLCLVVFWAEIVFNAYDRPWLTGVILLVIAGGALLFSMLFERYTWCRYACPLGALNAVFSMPSVLELRANREMCMNQCRDHTCFRGTEEVPGCPMFRHPFLVDNNKDCILCGRCIRNCSLRSIELNFRLAPQELWSLRETRLSDNFLIVALGTIYFFLAGHDLFFDRAAVFASLLAAKTAASPVMAGTLFFWGGILLGWTGYLLLSFLQGMVLARESLKVATVFGYGLLPLVLGGYLAYYADMFIQGAWRIGPNVLDLFAVNHAMQEFHLLTQAGKSTLLHTILLGGIFASLYAVFKIFSRLEGRNFRLFHLALPLLTVLGIGAAAIAVL